jgi:hypothetical protein
MSRPDVVQYVINCYRLLLLVVVVLLSSSTINIKIGFDHFLPIIFVTMLVINPETRRFLVRVTSGNK